VRVGEFALPREDKDDWPGMVLKMEL